MARRKITAFLLVIAMLCLSLVGLAEGEDLRFEEIPTLLRPGKTEIFSFYSSQAAQTQLILESQEGELLGIPLPDIHAVGGQNTILWDGELEDELLSPGVYSLVLKQGETEVRMELSVGNVSPRLSELTLSDSVLAFGDPNWSISAVANMQGKLHVNVTGADGLQREILASDVPAGSLIIPWDGSMHDGQADPLGTVTLSLTLEDDEGFLSNPQHLILNIQDTLQLPEDQADQGEQRQEQGMEEPYMQVTDELGGEALVVSDEPADQTEAPKSHYKLPTQEEVALEDQGKSFWSLPIGEWNEEKIWDVMMQPITIVEGGDQRQTYKLRAAPDKSTARENILGEITYVSQGVHVIESLDSGWSLVEVYNSSYGPNNTSRRGYGDTNAFLRGYVETNALKTITPRDDYGVLIDKLKQEMYVFKEGKLFTTLSVSTGKPTKQQPWNETPSGEFLMVSRVGDFLSGNMVCGMGMRINGGCLIHEVPYIVNQTTGYKDYSSQERVLGEKASHGCIRVQRKDNADGISMTWVWNNIKVNTKVLVWEDSGRFREYPADELKLYFNPDNGQYYHSDERCSSIRDRFLPLKGSMSYAELDDAAYEKLTPCKSCNPPLRRVEIEALNRENGF